MVFWKSRKVKFNLSHTICHIQLAANIGTNVYVLYYKTFPSIMQSIICCIVKLVYCCVEANFGHRTKNLYFRYTTKLLWRVRFKLRPVNVSLVVNKLALGHVFFRVFQISPKSITPPMVHTHI